MNDIDKEDLEISHDYCNLDMHVSLLYIQTSALEGYVWRASKGTTIRIIDSVIVVYESIQTTWPHW